MGPVSHEQKTPSPEISDDAWLVQLAATPEFKDRDLRREYERFVAHIHENPTRRRFLGWLRNSEKPMKLNPHQAVATKQVDLKEPEGWREKVDSIWNGVVWQEIPRDSQAAICKLFQ